MGFKITIPQRDKAPQPGEDHLFDKFIENWCMWDPDDRDGWWYEWESHKIPDDDADSNKQSYIISFLRHRGDQEEEMRMRAENATAHERSLVDCLKRQCEGR